MSLLNTTAYFERLDNNETLTPAEIRGLLVSHQNLVQFATYLSECTAATCERLPASTSNSVSTRFAAIITKAVEGMQGRFSYPDKQNPERALERCEDVAKELSDAIRLNLESASQRKSKRQSP